MTSPLPRRSVRLRSLRSVGLAAILGAALAGPALGAAPDPGTANAQEVAPARVPGVSLIKGGFTQPLFVTHANDSRLFVVERTGRIRILKNVAGSWTITGTFLDLRGSVAIGHSEQGLLGLAFHPDYATNGRFYVDYTNLAGDTVVAEFRRRTSRKADPESRRIVLKINQPFDNHNGGWIAFKGEYLYIATGDGGSGGDPFENGQDKGTRLGKILRIDPLDPDGPGGRKFAIPSDNPFVGRPGLDEIWAYGLRNPWRNSFDAVTGHLWVGDVGQDRYEEISRSGDGRGRNFGWDRLEGRHLYPSGALCTSDCRTLPIVEYRHSVNGLDNCSVVGGYVSRRPGAALAGRYLFSDACSGRIWDIPAGHAGGSVGAPLETGMRITSFGEGHDRTLYVTDYASGGIYRVNGS